MANYTDWNQALISYFTTGASRDSKIYLSVDDEVLDRLGPSFSSTPSSGNWKDDFCHAVKQQVIRNEQVNLTSLQGRDEKGFPKGVAFFGCHDISRLPNGRRGKIN